MQAKLCRVLPIGDQWRYELKLDGYRAEAIRTASGVKLISRNRKDLSSAYPELVDAVAHLNMGQGVLDGEIVAVDAAGKPSFQALQHLPRPGRGSRPIYYFAFDLLNLEGKSLLCLPLTERKRLLETVLDQASTNIRLSEFLDGSPEAILSEICRYNLEGVVAKLATSRHEPDKRSGAWVKFKCGYQQEFVIGGYTRGSGGRSAFGALIVGFYEGGKLRYASKVGTGFSNAQIREIIAMAETLRHGQSPFDCMPEGRSSSWSYGLTALERRTAIWLKPLLVYRVRFTEWTQDGDLRHPTFLGMRERSEAKEVVKALVSKH